MDGWMVEQAGTVAVSGASRDLCPGSLAARAMAKQCRLKRDRKAETQRQLKRRRAAADAGFKRDRKAEIERRKARGGRQEESKRRQERRRAAAAAKAAAAKAAAAKAAVGQPRSSASTPDRQASSTVQCIDA